MGIKDKGTEITDIKNKSGLILETKINAKPHPTERLNRRYLKKGHVLLLQLEIHVHSVVKYNLFILLVCLPCTTVS